MNFKDLNQHRLQLVIRNATSNSLNEFYRKNQKRLIIEGVKIQIIPPDFRKGVELFASFKPNAVSIARDWFENNLDLIGDISLEDAINTLIKVENHELESSEELQSLNSKIIFMELLKKEPDKRLLEYMQTDNGLTTEEKSKSKKSKSEEKLSLNRVIDFLDKKVSTLEDLSLDELLLLSIVNIDTNDAIAVSYTHLDVYKRQAVCSLKCIVMIVLI